MLTRKYEEKKSQDNANQCQSNFVNSYDMPTNISLKYRLRHVK